MNFLLDTNVVSEWVKPHPDEGVIAWLAEIDEDRVFISVATLTELRYAIERLALGAQRERLEIWASQELPQRFEWRVLSIDGAIADASGRLMALREAEGRPMNAMDAFIAATASGYELTLVTRNVSEFTGAVEQIVNPWRNG